MLSANREKNSSSLLCSTANISNNRCLTMQLIFYVSNIWESLQVETMYSRSWKYRFRIQYCLRADIFISFYGFKYGFPTLSKPFTRYGSPNFFHAKVFPQNTFQSLTKGFARNVRVLCIQ